MHAASGTETPRLHRVLPAGPTITLTDPDARSALLDSYRLDEPTWLRLTLVSTLDGRAAGGDGTSESLTSRVDRTVLGVVRELSDAVLVGAESLRREPGLVPRARPLVVLSASGHLGAPCTAPSGSTAPPLLVATTPAGAQRLADERPEAEALVLIPDHTGRLPLAAVIDALRDRGLRCIAAEGGPRVAGALLRAGLVDEICLTLMPLVGGAELPLLGGDLDGLGEEPLSRLRLRQLLADDTGALYGRWSTR